MANKYDLDVIVGNHINIGSDFDFALKSADSKIVTIAHQDDIYEEKYVETILDNYKRFSDASIIFTNYYEIRNGKRVFSNVNLLIKRVLLFPLFFKSLSGIKHIKRNALRYGNSICCPAVSFVKENCPDKIFECDLKCNVDWFAWEKLSKIDGKFIYDKKKLMGHRIDQTTTTTDIINQGIRTKEDLYIYEKFWPKFIAKIFNFIYRNSENSNRVKEK